MCHTILYLFRNPCLSAVTDLTEQMSDGLVNMVTKACHRPWDAYGKGGGEFILLVFAKHTLAFQNFNSNVTIREDSALQNY